MKKRIFLTLFLAILLMTALSGCAGGTKKSSEHKSSNHVVVGIQQDVDSLDPHKATAAGTKEILFNIFEGLVKSDENGNLMNAVASDYVVSDDGLTYTFTLRDGIKFHNGEDVTVEDVKYSLERASGLLDGTVLISSLKTLTGVNIVDENTVSVTVSSANTELIYSFVAAIIPQGSGEDEAGAPIGTGPFSFVSYQPQEGMVVEKFADYWQKGLPKLDKVTFKIVTNPDTALLDLKGGSIDIYPYLTDSQAGELKKDFQILSQASDVVQALFLNNATAPFDDVRVRQAINYALDKKTINDFVAGGNGVPVSSAMLPTLRDFYEDLNDVYGLDQNIEEAKKLLKEAGYENGLDIEITVPSNYEFHMQTAEVVVDVLAKAGINAKINPVEWNTWLDEVYNGRKYQSTICGITCDMTPGYLLNRFQTESPKNFINFSNAEYDEVYLKAQAALNLTEKAEYYKRLQEILTEEAGSAFIQIPPITLAMNPGLTGYKFYPIYVQDMSTVEWK